MRKLLFLLPLLLFGQNTPSELSSEKICWQGSSLVLEKVLYSGFFFNKSLSITGEKGKCLFSSEKIDKNFSLSLEDRIECLFDKKYHLSCGKITYTPEQTIFCYPTPNNPCLLSYDNHTVNTTGIKINKTEASLQKPQGKIPFSATDTLTFSADELSFSLDSRALVLHGNVHVENPNQFILEGEKISCFQNEKEIKNIVSEGKTEIFFPTSSYQIFCLGTIEVNPTTKEVFATGSDPLILETKEATIYASEAHVSYSDNKDNIQLSLEKSVRFITKNGSCMGMADSLTFYPSQNLYVLSCHAPGRVLLQQKDKGSLTADALRIQRTKGNDLISAEGVVHVSFSEEEEKLFQELFSKFLQVR
jgi:lipopolysaccharide export system protein LptA